jgi:hypothetical protein
MSIASDAVTIQVLSIAPDTGSMSVSGSTPSASVDDPTPVFVLSDRLIVGQAPTISLDYVGGGPTDGTLIENTNATTSVPVNYTICDRTGWKMKVKHGLVQDPYGNMVRAESVDNDGLRHPQESTKSTSEDFRTGATRPEPVGDERFIDDEFPSGVNKTTDLDP